jgi:enoyl-CoA hydratase/carnithine racemase
MVFETISFEKKANILIISILGSKKDPERLSRLSSELEELRNEILLDQEIRVILLTGTEEGAFVFPVLIEDFEEKTPEYLPEKFFSISAPISKIEQPVIAVVPGDAIGQGLEMILSCDIRIGVLGSHYGLPQVKSGLIPWDGGTQRLARLIGKAKALEMILTGEAIDAQEAFRIGLINKVVAKEELMKAAMEIATKMASMAPISLRYIKEAIYKGMDMTLEQGLRLEADLYLLIHTTKDREEGIKAFRQKRSPKFEGK